MLRTRCAPGLWVGGLAAEPGWGQIGRTALDKAERCGHSETAALLRLSQCREERTGVRIAPEAAGSSGQHRAQLVLLLLLLQ